MLPLDVDLVVYYEGANQLQPATMLRHVQVNESFTLAEPPDGVVGTFDDAVAATSLLDRLALYSALAERLRNALRSSGAQPEPQKPAQQVTLPGFLADNDFPLARANEVLECEAIKQDLDAIRLALAEQGKAFALCSFAWLAHDFMTTDPVLGRNIFIQLNRAYWPFRYATVRTLADAQNQFFRAWAKANGAQLIDIAALLPMDQRLYIDAIHHTELGVRLKAWVMFVRSRNGSSASLPLPNYRARPQKDPHLCSMPCRRSRLRNSMRAADASERPNSELQAFRLRAGRELPDKEEARTFAADSHFDLVGLLRLEHRLWNREHHLALFHPL